MGPLIGMLLVLGFFGFLAFMAFAPKPLQQIAIAGMWGVLALATVISILAALFF